MFLLIKVPNKKLLTQMKATVMNAEVLIKHWNHALAARKKSFINPFAE